MLVFGDSRVPDTISQSQFTTAGSLATCRLVNRYTGRQLPLIGRSGRVRRAVSTLDRPARGPRTVLSSVTRELPRISRLLAGVSEHELVLRAWGIVPFSRHGNMPYLALPAVSGEVFPVVFTEAGRVCVSGVLIARLPPGTW